jgi:predicted CoA-binding protein
MPLRSVRRDAGLTVVMDRCVWRDYVSMVAG